MNQMKKSIFIFVVLAMVFALSCGICAAEPWDGSVSTYLQPVDPTKDYDATTNPMAISSPADWAYLVQQSAIEPSGGKVTYRVNGEEKEPLFCSRLSYRQTADLVLNDETFTMDEDSGIIVVTDGTHTGYLGTGMPGYLYNAETPSTYGEWYTADSLKGTLAVAENGYAGTLNLCYTIFRGPQSGVNTKKFRGSFDGNHYSIRGFYVDNETSFLNNGLFGNIYMATIKNVNMIDCCLLSGRQGAAGAIVSYCWYGKLENCFASGIQINRGNQGKLGGLMGNGRGYADSIVKCGYVGYLGSAASNGSTISGVYNDESDSKINCTDSYHIGTIAHVSKSGTYNGIGTCLGGATNCYSVGHEGIFSGSALLSQITSNKVVNCYYDKSFSSKSDKGTAVKRSELTAARLGLNWEEDKTGENYGYPVIKGQKGRAAEALADFRLTPVKSLLFQKNRILPHQEYSYSFSVADFVEVKDEASLSYICDKVYTGDGSTELTGASISKNGDNTFTLKVTATERNSFKAICPVKISDGTHESTVRVIYHFDVNRKPHITTESTEETFEMISGHTKYFSSPFKDEDGDKLTYECSISEDGGATFSDFSKTILSYKPEKAGNYILRYRAYDGYEYSDFFTYHVTVTQNHAPQLVGSDRIKVNTPTGCSWNYDIRTIFTDADKDTVRVSVSIDGAEPVSAGYSYYSFKRYQVGKHTLVFSATDGIEACSKTFTVELTVNKYGYTADVWNGAVDISWYDEYVDVFTLNTPAQLAGLAAIVNGYATDTEGNVLKDDFADRTIKLGKDICLNDASFSFDEASGTIEISSGENKAYLGTGYPGTDDSIPSLKEDVVQTDLHDPNSVVQVQDLSDKWICGDISLRKWSSIGRSGSPFKGTFDGQNHKISGQFIKENNGALFGQCSGIIKNVILTDGLCTGNYGNASLVNAFNGSLLENCESGVIVNCASNASSCGGLILTVSPSQDSTLRHLTYNSVVLGTSSAGGIATSANPGNNATLKIMNCTNNGTILNKSLSASMAGGVLGSATAGTNGNLILSELVNTGNVGLSNKRAAKMSGGIIGSLSGMRNGNVVLENLYNTGTVYSSNKVGGIAGNVSSGYIKPTAGDVRITSCYNAGELFANSKKYEAAFGNFDIKYSKGNSYCKDVFYLTNPEADATHVDFEGVTSKTTEEMHSEEFLLELGEAFGMDSYGINDGYPILTFQSDMANEKGITAFSIGDVVGSMEGKTVNVPDYAIAAEGDTLTFAPIIEVSAGAAVKPASGEEVVFTQSKEDDSLYTAKYVVTAANGSKRSYTVNVHTKAAVSGFALKETEVSVVAGYLGKELVPVFSPVNANNKAVTWISGDETIATVDEKGVVTGVKVGTTTITATTEDGGKTAVCTVTVTPYVSVTSITLPETASVMKDETTTLTATIAPENASNQSVIWSSEDEDIATVDEKGVVTGVSVGTVKITATAKDASLETPLVAECSFTVTKIPVESVTLTQTKYVRVGGSKLIPAVVAPESATEQGLIWSSSDESLATVDEKGVVTGKAPGKVTITATAKDNSEIKGSVDLEICKEYPYDVDWNGVFNATESNNNTSEVPLPTDPEKIEEVWRVEAGNGSVAIVDNYVYTYAAAVGMNGYQIGGESKAFYKINKETGEVEDMIHNCPGVGNYYYAYTIYGDGMLYVSAPSAVMAFDIDTFSLAWTASVGGGMYSAVQFVNGCVLANGRVLNGATGELIRDLEETYNYSNGAVVGGKYYCIPSYEGTMYSFDATTWKPVSSCTFKTQGTVLQPGAVYHNGRLYWGDAMGAYCYSVKIDSDTGVIDQKSLIKRETNFTTTCTPVAYGNRIYLAGQGSGGGTVNVYDAETMELIYQAVGANQKIQSTPILYADKETGIAYIYAQEYGGSAIYLLADDGKQTSGRLEKLVKPSMASFAFEQLACDKDGALYCTNDSGHLFKFQVTTVKKPKLETDLSTDRVVEILGEAAAPLSVKAVSADGGTLSYQWQVRSANGGWVDMKGQTTDTVVPDTSSEGKSYYRCVVTNTRDDKSTSIYSSEAQIVVVPAGKEQITVSFRLIGATKSTEDVNFTEAPNDYKDSEYVTWQKTKLYTIDNGATVGDLFKQACDEAGIRYEGWENDYIRTIYAPESCGGYELSEFTNGQYSGWMYTLNGKHASKSMCTQDLADGDVVIWHYVNDYRYEDESTNPDSPYLGQYLKAPDRNPGETETDEEIAKPVSDMIAALPENITLADGDAIAAARAAYDKLTKEQRGYVENFDKLTAAEAAYAELTKVKENPFTDVKEGDYFFDAVLWAVENKVTNGTSATTFEPALACNRGQVVTFLWRAAGEPAPTATDCAFTDVKADAYYYKAVLWAVEKGITNGVSATEFAPDAAVTRGQAVTFLYRYAGKPEVNGAMTFSDVAEGEYYYDAVLWAVANKITNGMGDGAFAPGDVVTRGQAVTFLYRAR